MSIIKKGKSEKAEIGRRDDNYILRYSMMLLNKINHFCRTLQTQVGVNGQSTERTYI